MNGFLRMCLNIITQIGPYLCSTPAAYSSSRQARMATFRWLVGWLPPFTMSGMTMTTDLPGPASSFSGGMADGVADGRQGSGVQAVPVLGQTGRIRYRLPGDEDIRAVGSSHPAGPAHTQIPVSQNHLF